MNTATLADVAKKTLAGDSFSLSLRNFLDEFYAHPSVEALLPEPPLLARTGGGEGAVRDAYLAATAEALAQAANLPCPVWAFSKKRKLKRPWFAMKASSLRALLLWESPASFRSRNLFVSRNALSRA